MATSPTGRLRGRPKGTRAPPPAQRPRRLGRLPLPFFDNPDRFVVALALALARDAQLRPAHYRLAGSLLATRLGTGLREQEKVVPGAYRGAALRRAPEKRFNFSAPVPDGSRSIDTLEAYDRRMQRLF